MSWMNWFFKRDGVAVTMSQDSTTISGTLAVTGATSLTGLVTASGGLTLTGTTAIDGITISSHSASPEAAITGNRKGDLCVDYTNSNVYIFTGTATQNTGWKLVTRAG
jgi:hypothetical protein